MPGGPHFDPKPWFEMKVELTVGDPTQSDTLALEAGVVELFAELAALETLFGPIRAE